MVLAASRTMRIQNYQDVWEVRSAVELEAILVKKPQSDVNEYWLSHGEEKYPAISLLVKGEIASLSYLPEGGHPGYVSAGKVPGLDLFENTQFSTTRNRADDVSVSNQHVIPSSDAVAAAKEFLISTDLPKNVEWSKLWQ